MTAAQRLDAAGSLRAGLSPRRRRKDALGRLTVLGMAAVSVAALLVLLGAIVLYGAPAVDWTFLTSPPSSDPERAGILPALVGTLWIGAVSMLVAVPVGMAAAVYLQEFARPGWLTTLLRTSIANLAGVPSIVFGILGLALFARGFGLGLTVAAAGLTLGLLTLPIVIVVCEEALKAVPRSIREAALALGASRWQAVRHHVLPYAMPGMATASILALSRAVGETAPLIVLTAATYISFLPDGPLSRYTALPVQGFFWANEADPAFHTLAWGAILVLIVLVVLGNLAAIVLRERTQRRFRW